MERCWTKLLLQPVVCRQYVTIHKIELIAALGYFGFPHGICCSNDRVKGCNQEASSQLGPRPVGDPSASAAMDGVICAAATMKDKQNPARPPVWSTIFSLSCAKIWQDVLLILWFIRFVSLTYLHLSLLRGNTDYERLNPSLGILWTQGKPSSLLVMPSKSFRRKSPWQHHQQTPSYCDCSCLI